MPSIAYITGAKEAETLTRVASACKKHWPNWKSDCSGFVKAVAVELGYYDLFGQANNIIDQMQKQPWRKLSSGKEAAQQASLGKFVLAGHKRSPNGHVVVVMPGGPVYGKYPYAYWGSLILLDINN